MGFGLRLLLRRGGIRSWLNDDGEVGGGLRWGDPGGMRAQGAAWWWLGADVADVAPGELVG